MQKTTFYGLQQTDQDDILHAIKSHPKYKRYLKPVWGLGFVKREPIPDWFMGDVIQEDCVSYHGGYADDATEGAVNAKSRQLQHRGLPRRLAARASDMVSDTYKSLSGIILGIRLILMVWRIIRDQRAKK